MIVTKDWIWLHVPKCGGTAVELAMRQALRHRSDAVFDTVDHKKAPIWHHSIRRRKLHDPDFSADGKKIIACIRRLPDWLLSRVHFEAARTKKVPTREQFVKGEFHEATGYLNKADKMIREFDNPRVDHWIRLEHMLEDLNAATGLNMPSIPRANENKLSFVKNSSFWFSKDEMRALYENNPRWAEIEMKVYGWLPHSEQVPATQD